MAKRLIIAVFSIILPLIACSQDINVGSNSFARGQMMPGNFTCDGENKSPSLSWDDSLSGIISYAVIMEDTDAPVGSWVHWIVFNIPAGQKGLAEGAGNTEGLSSGIKHGLNDWGRPGYGGPCPPGKSEHRYYFRVYALDRMLELEKPEKSDIEKAMQGHIIGKGEIMARYRRQ